MTKYTFLGLNEIPLGGGLSNYHATIIDGPFDYKIEAIRPSGLQPVLVALFYQLSNKC